MKEFFKFTSSKIIITIFIASIFMAINILSNLTVRPLVAGELVAPLPMGISILSSLENMILIPLLPIWKVMVSITKDSYSSSGMKFIKLSFLLYYIIYFLYIYLISCCIVFLRDKIRMVYLR